MKMEKTVNTKFKHALSFIFGATAALIASNAHAVTLSGEEFKEYAPEEAYWVVSVNCEDGSDSRVIQRKTDGNKWCGKEVDGYCFDTKADAADKVCAADYTATLNQIKQAEREKERQEQARLQAERERREAAAREAAEREKAAEAKRQAQIQIDEKLLQIEQEKLSLRRQELELQRRAVEIREALEELDK